MEVRLGLINKNIARVLQLHVFMPDDNFHLEIFIFYNFKRTERYQKGGPSLEFSTFLYDLQNYMRPNGPLFGFSRYNTQYFEIVFISRKGTTQFFEIRESPLFEPIFST